MSQRPLPACVAMTSTTRCSSSSSRPETSAHACGLARVVEARTETDELSVDGNEAHHDFEDLLRGFRDEVSAWLSERVGGRIHAPGRELANLRTRSSPVRGDMSRYPEIQTVDAWIAATAARRAEIAEEISVEHGLALETVAPFRREDLPLASYRGLHDLFRFVLVPGGTFTMGLGDAELARLHDAARAHDGDQRGWASLLASPSPMRPVCTRTVGPLLVAQSTIGGFDVGAWREEMGELFLGEGAEVSSLPTDLDAGLAKLGYRLPWEHEWEWCARGGRTGELTFKGNRVPDEAHLRRIREELLQSQGPDEGDRHATLGNDFGLLGFGVDAELCRDRYRSELGGPTASVPEIEERTVRGGAGATYPWQNAGEWHGLLTAFRARCGTLKYALGVRLVRDVSP